MNLQVLFIVPLAGNKQCTSLGLSLCARLPESLRSTTSTAAAAADAAEDDGEDGDEKAEEKCTYDHPSYLSDGEVCKIKKSAMMK